MKINLLFKTHNDDFIQVNNYFIEDWPSKNLMEVYSLIDSNNELSLDNKITLGIYKVTGDINILKLLVDLNNYTLEQVDFQRNIIGKEDLKYGQVFIMPKSNHLNLLN